MQKLLQRLIPDSLKPILKKSYYFSTGFIDKLMGRDSMIPPRSMIFIGSGDFTKIGEEFKKYFIELANLQPDNRVLDVGCGIGRMAIPLTSYLSPAGEYWGLDIVMNGIEWCQSRISPKFNNFHFQHSDVYNHNYNPKGKIQAQDFRFPFENDFFDFVFLTSVFTHMLPLDVENYLSEISRVLKPGGKCLITFFILNDEAEKLTLSGRSTLDFKYDLDGCFTTDRDIPESAIAYTEEAVIRLFTDRELSITRPIHYGSWCARENFLTYQDLIIATKNNSN